MYRNVTALVLFSITAASASTIVSATTSTTPPLTMYAYTVMSAGPETVFEFTLFLQGPVMTDTIASPAGWSVSFSPIFVDWFAIDPSQEIAPGTSLGGFSFSSLQLPNDSALFVTIGTDSLGNVVVTSDNTIGPSASVPEPSTGPLLLCALIIGLMLKGASYTNCHSNDVPSSNQSMASKAISIKI